MIRPFQNSTTATDQQLISIVSGLLSQHGFHVSVDSSSEERLGAQLAATPDTVSRNGGQQGLGRGVGSLPKAAILIMVDDRDEMHSDGEREIGGNDLSAEPIIPILTVRPGEPQMEATKNTGKTIEVDRLTIDKSQRVCTLDGEEVDLTTAEFELLWMLANHAGSAVSRRRLHQELLGVKYDGRDRSIDLRVSRLRRKLRDDPNHPRLVKSIRGVGYLLAAPGRGPSC